TMEVEETIEEEIEVPTMEVEETIEEEIEVPTMETFDTDDEDTLIIPDIDVAFSVPQMEETPEIIENYEVLTSFTADPIASADDEIYCPPQESQTLEYPEPIDNHLPDDDLRKYGISEELIKLLNKDK
ncbi:MAG: hypothetical protein R3Y12_05990, partial [Clostridia bacterium]